jgi:hypothetical protein
MRSSDLGHAGKSQRAVDQTIRQTEWAFDGVNPGIDEAARVWDLVTNPTAGPDGPLIPTDLQATIVGTRTDLKVFTGMTGVPLDNREAGMAMVDRLAMDVIRGREEQTLRTAGLSEKSGFFDVVGNVGFFEALALKSEIKPGQTLFQTLLNRRATIFVETNFEGIADFNALNPQCQEIFREAMAKFAPHSTLFNNQEALAWINDPAQVALNAQLQQLMGPTIFADGKNPDLLALLVYLRKQPTNPGDPSPADRLTTLAGTVVGSEQAELTRVDAYYTSISQRFGVAESAGKAQQIIESLEGVEGERIVAVEALQALEGDYNVISARVGSPVHPLTGLELAFFDAEAAVTTANAVSATATTGSAKGRKAALENLTRAETTRDRVEDRLSKARDELRKLARERTAARSALTTKTRTSASLRRRHNRIFAIENASGETHHNSFTDLPAVIDFSIATQATWAANLAALRAHVPTLSHHSDQLHTTKERWVRLKELNFDDITDPPVPARATLVPPQPITAREAGYGNFEDLKLAHDYAATAVRQSRSRRRKGETSLNPVEILRRLYVTDPDFVANGNKPDREFQATVAALLLSARARNDEVYNARIRRLAEGIGQENVGSIRERMGRGLQRAMENVNLRRSFAEFTTEHIQGDDDFKTKSITLNASVRQINDWSLNASQLKKLIENFIKPIAQDDFDGASLGLNEDVIPLLERLEVVYYTMIAREEMGSSDTPPSDPPALFARLLDKRLSGSDPSAGAHFMTPREAETAARKAAEEAGGGADWKQYIPQALSAASTAVGTLRLLKGGNPLSPKKKK